MSCHFTTVGSGGCGRRVSGVKRILGAATLLLQRHVIILQQCASLFRPLGRSRFLLHEAQQGSRRLTRLVSNHPIRLLLRE